MTDELTKSQLYSIYNTSELENENDINELYSHLNENIRKSENLITKESSIKHAPKSSQFLKLLYGLFKIFLLGVLGILYHQLSLNIHDNHILVKELASKPLNVGITITNFLLFEKVYIPSYLIYALEGILFGSILPIFDTLTSSSPNNGSYTARKTRVIDSSSLIRSLVAFLGVSFAIRKIEWNSSLQAAITWCLLNPVLWYLLDSSVSGFVSGVSIASLASLSFVLFDNGLRIENNEEFWAVLIWLGNFFFFGLIVFGKVGRYLFN